MATTPKSSTVEHRPTPAPANRTVNGLFAAACEAGRHVHAHEAQHVEKHTDIVLKALQCVMELVELGREQPTELQSLLDYHKARRDLDAVGRVVKLAFPNETPQLRNCYADALRYAERNGQSAEQTPAFLRESGIKKAAREEAKVRRKKKPSASKSAALLEGQLAIDPAGPSLTETTNLFDDFAKVAEATGFGNGKPPRVWLGVIGGRVRVQLMEREPQSFGTPIDPEVEPIDPEVLRAKLSEIRQEVEALAGDAVNPANIG